jgi:hypothetical protein
VIDIDVNGVAVEVAVASLRDSVLLLDDFTASFCPTASFSVIPVSPKATRTSFVNFRGTGADGDGDGDADVAELVAPTDADPGGEDGVAADTPAEADSAFPADLGACITDTIHYQLRTVQIRGVTVPCPLLGQRHDSRCLCCRHHQ